MKVKIVQSFVKFLPRLKTAKYDFNEERQLNGVRISFFLKLIRYQIAYATHATKKTFILLFYRFDIVVYAFFCIYTRPTGFNNQNTQVTGSSSPTEHSN